MRHRAFFLLKCTLSVVLLGYLLVSADIQRLGDGLLKVDLYYFTSALIIGIAAVVVSAYKWQALLIAGGVDCQFWPLIRYYLIGIYFNNFLPTSFGGDAARIYLSSKKYGNRALIALSVLVERISGLIAMFVFLLLGVMVGPRILEPGQEKLVFLVCCSALLFTGLLSLTAVRLRLQKLLPRGLSDKLAQLTVGVYIDYRSRHTGWKVIWTSLLFQFFSILIYVLVARALNLSLSFLDLLAVVPLVTLLTLLPLSLNGLGLREGGFVFLLARLHVSNTEALSLSLLFYTIPVILSVVGGGLFLFLRPVTRALEGSSR